MPDIYISSPKKRIANQARKIIQKVGEKKTNNPLAAFIALPKKINFETQDKEEKIILLLRQHWITNLRWFLISFLMLISPYVLKFFPLLSFLPSRFKFIVLIMWYLFIMAFVFENFLSWFFNVYIITDERIIDVDFISLVYRKISEAKIERIQDITYKTGGLFKAFFNYGDVYIQTASEVPEIEFESVPKPAKIVKILDQLVIQEEKEKIEGRIR